MYDKYYTPAIEEFHIGFEYELFLDSADIGFQWNKMDMDTSELLPLSNIEELLERHKVRVKYLDIDDLNEIGFKHIGGKLLRDVGQLFVFNNGRYFVHVNYTRFSDRCVLKIETSVFENSVRTLVVHSIGIKNKSELLKLMAQLNIL